MAFKTLVRRDGKEYIFDAVRFNEIFESYVSEQKKENQRFKKTKLFEIIGDAVGVSPDAVKQWKGQKNGVSDLETVKSIAEFFDVHFERLLTVRQEDIGMDNNISINNTSSAKELVNEIYQELIRFFYAHINDFERIPGHPEIRDIDYIRRYYDNWISKLHEKVDIVSLSIDEDIARKLHVVILEVGECRFGKPLGRWERINPYFDYAKTLYDPCLSYISETWMEENGIYEELQERFLNDITKKQVFTDGRMIVESLDDVDRLRMEGEEAWKKAEKIYERIYENLGVEELEERVDFQPAFSTLKKENFYPKMVCEIEDYEPDEEAVYLREFVITLREIFKMDFAEILV